MPPLYDSKIPNYASPILVGETFTYDFPVTQAGTFWVHSHATGQYPKGLRSPLIITDSAEPTSIGYDSNYDFVFTISDW
jgi:iron transport multicopper oxidase